MSRRASTSRAVPTTGAVLLLAAVLAAPGPLAAPASADVLELRSTGKVVETKRLGWFTETYAATVVAADGTRRALPDFVVGGSGEPAEVTPSPDGRLVAVGFGPGVRGVTVVPTDGGPSRSMLFNPTEVGYGRSWSPDGRRLFFDVVRTTGEDSPRVPGRLGSCDVARSRCVVRRVSGALSAALPDGRLVSVATAEDRGVGEAEVEGLDTTVPRRSAAGRRIVAAAARRSAVRITVADATTTRTVRRETRALPEGIDVASAVLPGPAGVLVLRDRVRSRLVQSRRCRVERAGRPPRVARRCVRLAQRGITRAAPVLVGPDGVARVLPRLRYANADVVPVHATPDGRWLAELSPDYEASPGRPSGEVPPPPGVERPALVLVSADGTVAPLLTGGRPATPDRIAAAVGRRSTGDGEEPVLGVERATNTLVVRIEVLAGRGESDPSAVVRLPLDGGAASLVAIEDPSAADGDAPRGALVEAW